MCMLTALSAQAYVWETEGNRATSLTDGAYYVIYNSCSTSNYGKFFIYDNGTSLGVTAAATPAAFTSPETKHIWQVIAAGDANIYYLKNLATGKYVNVAGVPGHDTEQRISIMNASVYFGARGGEVMNEDGSDAKDANNYKQDDLFFISGEISNNEGTATGNTGNNWTSNWGGSYRNSGDGAQAHAFYQVSQAEIDALLGSANHDALEKAITDYTAELAAIVGDCPGQYLATDAGIVAAQAAIQAAQAILDDATKGEDDFAAAKATLDADYAAAMAQASEKNTFVEGAVYKVVNQKAQWISENKTKVIYDNGTKPMWASLESGNPYYYWTYTAADGTQALQNVGSEKYIASYDALSETPVAITFTELTVAGQYNVIVSGSVLHAEWHSSAEGSTLCSWSEGADSPSAWKFVPVTEEEIAAIGTYFATLAESTKTEATAALAKTGLGYPVAEAAERTALQQALEGDMTTSAGVKALIDALTAYKTCSNIELPAAGKAYRIKMLYGNGGEDYLYKGEDSNLKHAEMASITDAASTIFLCTKDADGKYHLINNNGGYMPYTNGDNGAFEATSSNNTAWTIQAAQAPTNGANVGNYVAGDFFGRFELYNANSGHVLLPKKSSGSFHNDAAPSRWYGVGVNEHSYTCIFEPVDDFADFALSAAAPEAGGFDALPAEVVLTFSTNVASLTATIDAIGNDGQAKEQVTVDASAIAINGGVVTITIDPASIADCKSYTLNYTATDAFTRSVTGSVAYEVVFKSEAVTSLDQLSNNVAYTIKSARGYMIVDAAKAEGKAWCTGRDGSYTIDTENANFQWAIITTEKGRYLYNVGSKKFLYKSGKETTLTDNPLAADVNFPASTGAAKADYPWVVAFGSNQINMSTNQVSGILTDWNSTSDEGNMVAIESVADFDPTDALAAIANVKPTLIARIAEFQATIAATAPAYLCTEATTTAANNAIAEAQTVVDNTESTDEEEQAALDALEIAIDAYEEAIEETTAQYDEIKSYIENNVNSWAEAMHATMPGLITKAEQITSNSVSTSEGTNGPTALLIDGDVNTYYHGGYGNQEVSDVNYLQVSLDAPAGDVWFYINRRNDNNRPTNITVSGSTDGETFTEIRTFDWNMALSGAATAWGIVNGAEYTTLRFAVNKTNGGTKFFTASEFQIHALPTGTVESAVVDLVNSYFGIETNEDLNATYAKIQAVEEALDPKITVDWKAGARVSKLEAGKQYLIYNTAYSADNSQDRTGFLKAVEYSSFGHSGKILPSALTFTRTSDLGYVWTVEPTAEANVFYIKNYNGKYINNKGQAVEAPYKFTIEEWTASTATRGGVNSLAEDEVTIVANADITAANKVWTVSTEATGNDKCWNGNQGSFGTWSEAHPYAFYEMNYAVEMEAAPASASSVMSKLDPVTLTFTNFEAVTLNPEVTQGYTISKDGEVPANVETALFVAENNAVKFGQSNEGALMPIATEPGVYTITIPAGKFLLGDYKLLSKEITLTYTVEKATEAEFTPAAGNYETLPTTVTVNYTNDISGITSVTIDAVNIDGVAQEQIVLPAENTVINSKVVTINVAPEALANCDTYTMTITAVDRFDETVTSTVTYTAIKATEAEFTPAAGNYETLPTTVTIEFTNKIESVTSVTVDATATGGEAKEQIVIANEAITQNTRNIVIAVNEADLYGCNTYTLTYTVVDRFGETITGSAVYTADITTGIATITGDGKNVVIYDLTGRKVKTVAPGKVYIKNNKKYIAK